MSELEHYLRDGFRPTPATRRLIAAVRREASLPANKGELGAWLFVFAQLSTMTESELRARGCPADQVEPLLRFARKAAVDIAAPIVPAIGERDPETLQQTSEFIARIAQLQWGTEAGTAAFIDWLKRGHGHIAADLLRDPNARRLLGRDRPQ
jgi:hypothetical protein